VALEKVEQQKGVLAHENVAMGSLLAMVCDSIFWLAHDGDTIVRHDGKLEFLLGQNLPSSFFSQHVVERDQPRLRHCFASFAQSGAGQPPPVQLIHVAILRPNGPEVQVNLFIVDRRGAPAPVSMHTHAEEDPSPAFLIGMCTKHQSEEVYTTGPEQYFLAHSDSSSGPATLTAGSNATQCLQPALGKPTPTELILGGSTEVLCELAQQLIERRPVARVAVGDQLVCIETVTGKQCTQTVERITAVPVQPSERQWVEVNLKQGSSGMKVLTLPGSVRFFMHGPRQKKRWCSAKHLDKTGAQHCFAYGEHQSSAALPVKLLTDEVIMEAKHSLTAPADAFEILLGSSTAPADAFEILPGASTTKTAVLIHAGSCISNQESGLPVAVAVAVSPTMQLASSAPCSHCSVRSAVTEMHHESASIHARKVAGISDGLGTVCSNVAGLPPQAPPFQPSNPYLSECSLSLLDDLLHSWNYEGQGCCAWHLACERLASAVAQLHRFHDCSDGWRPHSGWQCSYCSGLHPPETASCWICQQE